MDSGNTQETEKKHCRLTQFVLKIIALCFYLHFTQRYIFFGIRVVDQNIGLLTLSLKIYTDDTKRNYNQINTNKNRKTTTWSPFTIVVQ